MTDVVPVPVRQLDPELPLRRTPIPGTPARTWWPPRTWSCRRRPGPGATGVAVALPEGYVGLVHPRSGLAARLGVTVLNAPGTVDAGYRGEILVNLINHDREAPARISRGDRIAQLVVQRVARADFRPVAELPASRRGTGGHGSTGGHAGLVPAPAGGQTEEVAG